MPEKVTSASEGVKKQISRKHVIKKLKSLKQENVTMETTYKEDKQLKTVDYS